MEISHPFVLKETVFQLDVADIFLVQSGVVSCIFDTDVSSEARETLSNKLVLIYALPLLQLRSHDQVPNQIVQFPTWILSQLIGIQLIVKFRFAFVSAIFHVLVTHENACQVVKKFDILIEFHATFASTTRSDPFIEAVKSDNKFILSLRAVRVVDWSVSKLWVIQVFTVAQLRLRVITSQVIILFDRVIVSFCFTGVTFATITVGVRVLLMVSGCVVNQTQLVVASRWIHRVQVRLAVTTQDMLLFISLINELIVFAELQL